MTDKEEFLKIFTGNITRDGADKLLDFLENKSDFFTAPASTRYHNAFEGGLLRHSLNVYHCLCAYLERERVKQEYHLAASPETVAIVALLHDVCKVNFYRVGWRNVKNEQTGQWEKQPRYEIHAALRSWGEIRLHGERIHTPHPGGGNGYPLAYGILRSRGQEYRRSGARHVSSGVCALRRGYGGFLLPGRGRGIKQTDPFG